jgi:hypothetical protein
MITAENVSTTGGVFTIQLDFGAGVFNGDDRWIEVSISPAGQNNFTTLAPRQKFVSVPYSVRSLNALTAETSTDSLNLGNVPASQYVQTGDQRLSDARVPLPGSSDYVQNNSAVPQPNVSFNIGGTGSADILNAQTQFELGGSRVLSNFGSDNLFVGIEAGISITTGSANAFFGKFSGQTNTTGSSNSFVGNNSGAGNTTGSNNSFFGDAAGFRNATASNNSFFGFLAGFHNTVSDNSFFGFLAGADNTTGRFNSFFGGGAGQSNTTSFNNAFFGHQAGFANLTGNANSFFGSTSGTRTTTGNSNSFFGFASGSNNTTGSNNVFVGNGTGTANVTGSNNTTVGSFADLGAGDLAFATAIGSGAVVTSSNTLVLGRGADTVQVPGALNIAGMFGANSVNAATQFNLGGVRILSNSGVDNIFLGAGAGQNNTGVLNSFFGSNAGTANTTGNGNSFFGESSGRNNTGGFDNTFVGASSGRSNTIGRDNSFFGVTAGFSNTTGIGNSLFGSEAGASNTAGNLNAFFGMEAGRQNTTGSTNSFFGWVAGQNNTTASGNAFFGTAAGQNSTTGGGNSFFGQGAGSNNTTGFSNTVVGAAANVAAGGLSFATAIGANAVVSTSNTIVLGRTEDTVQIPGKGGAIGNFGVGTTDPLRTLQIGPGLDSLFTLSASDGTPSAGAIRFGDNTGWKFYIGRSREVSGGALNEGSTGALMTVQDNGRVGIGTTAPDQLFSVNGNASKVGGGSWATFSDERLKNMLGGFNAGLREVLRLRPIRYQYRPDNALGLRSEGEYIGFSAQEVQKVIPEAVSTTDSGFLQINNDPILWAMLNAIKQQQLVIEQQQTQIAELRQAVCSVNPQALTCKEDK